MPSIDRVALLFGGTRRARREIVSPEGVTLEVEIADRGERLVAFVLDMFFWLLATFVFYLIIVLVIVAAIFGGGSVGEVAMTVYLFLGFLVRNFYFTHFELAWQGCTPGKRICGLKVIDRKGGPLLPGAVVARNLTREVEVFLPIFLFASLSGGPSWEKLSFLTWTLVIAMLPVFNRDRLRAGDLIAGTMVIALPRQQLSSELADNKQVYQFTPRQLQIYGAFELQVLEELLRKPRSADSDRALVDVTAKICQKIGWTDELKPSETRDFLEAFYTAERAELERGQLFGHYRADKNAT